MMEHDARWMAKCPQLQPRPVVPAWTVDGTRVRRYLALLWMPLVHHSTDTARLLLYTRPIDRDSPKAQAFARARPPLGPGATKDDLAFYWDDELAQLAATLTQACCFRPRGELRNTLWLPTDVPGLQRQRLEEYLLDYFNTERGKSVHLPKPSAAALALRRAAGFPDDVPALPPVHVQDELDPLDDAADPPGPFSTQSRALLLEIIARDFDVLSGARACIPAFDFDDKNKLRYHKDGLLWNVADRTREELDLLAHPAHCEAQGPKKSSWVRPLKKARRPLCPTTTYRELTQYWWDNEVRAVAGWFQKANGEDDVGLDLDLRVDNWRDIVDAYVLEQLGRLGGAKSSQTFDPPVPIPCPPPPPSVVDVDDEESMSAEDDDDDGDDASFKSEEEEGDDDAAPAEPESFGGRLSPPAPTAADLSALHRL